MADAHVIRAAGVVLVRQGEAGLEVLLVHRPGRQDWSLPKGKLDAGEHVLAAAIRECDEETGFTPVLGAPLPVEEYLVEGVPKTVQFWRATVGADEGFAPDDEVDEIRWMPVAEVNGLLTYANDVHLVGLAAHAPDTVPLVILRHTQALKRSDFKGKVDSDRPLTGRGRSQSKELIPLLDAYGIDTVHSSTSRRCEETVRRFAKYVGAKVREEPDLGEERHHAKPQATARRARELAQISSPTVVCTHRPVLPTVLAALEEELGIDPADERWAGIWDARLSPGSFIVIHRAVAEDGRLRAVGVERHSLRGD